MFTNFLTNKQIFSNAHIHVECCHQEGSDMLCEYVKNPSDDIFSIELSVLFGGKIKNNGGKVAKNRNEVWDFIFTLIAENRNQYIPNLVDMTIYNDTKDVSLVPSICKLTFLESLTIYYEGETENSNNIKYFNLPDLSQMHSLKKLSLSRNVKLLPNLPKSLTSFEFLDCIIPDNVPDNVTCLKLSRLDLKNVVDHKIIKYLLFNGTDFLLENLQQLYISNLLKSNSVDHIMCQLPSTLTHLDISQNNLKKLPECICNLHNLIYLNISNNQINELPANFPKSIKILNASNNRLSKIPDINYEQLNVMRNVLTEFKCSSTILKNLNISHNRLKELDCSKYSELVYLSAISNLISNINISSTNIVSLYISDNRLSSLTITSNNLKILDASINLLRDVKISSTSLVNLDISRNKLTDIEQLPKSIKILDCGFNKLSSFINIPPEIVSLNIERNFLNEFVNIPKTLQFLNVANNNITKISVATNSKLFYLNVFNNKLTTIPKMPNSLKVLYVSYNKLKAIPKLPPNLEELYISGNKLTSSKHNFTENIKKTKTRSIKKTTNSPVSNVTSSVPSFVSDVSKKIKNQPHKNKLQTIEISPECKWLIPKGIVDNIIPDIALLYKHNKYIKHQYDIRV